LLASGFSLKNVIPHSQAPFLFNGSIFSHLHRFWPLSKGWLITIKKKHFYSETEPVSKKITGHNIAWQTGLFCAAELWWYCTYIVNH